MKKIVRVFVVLLAITGAASARLVGSIHMNQASVVGQKTSAMPIPTCPPDDPDACGVIVK